MPKRATTDQRQHQRVEARLAMQLAEEALGEALVTTESLNISRGGVYCESAEYLAPLSNVALTVVLPAFGQTARPRVLRTEGVVVRCEGLAALRGRKRYQLACCFTGLDTESRTLLDEFVNWRALKSRRAPAATKPAARPKRAVKTAPKRATRKTSVKRAAAKTAKPAKRATKAAPRAKRTASPKRAKRTARPKK